MFGYNAAGTRHDPTEKVLNSANVGTLVKNWSYATGNVIESSPTIVNGVLYITSEDGHLYALNSTTGTLLWSNGGLMYGGAAASPAVANGVVYFAQNARGVYALNAPLVL